MAYTTIKKPDDYFNTKVYTGTGSSNALTGVGFQPDLIWIKSRSNAYEHKLTDAIRGVTKELHSNDSSAEGTDANGVTAFGSDGFTVGSTAGFNGSGATFASWNWLGANGTVSNTDGSITSTVSANTTSGFSVVSYTGNTDASKTIGHGLGTAPSMIITKDRGNTRNWCVYHKSLGATQYLLLNGNGAAATSTGRWNDTAPTSSVFTVGDDAETGNAFNYIAYCFAEKQGFSKFGSYEGNGSGDGTFIYTGFKPAWLMIKNADGLNNWSIKDNKRDTYNPELKQLLANSSNAESDDAGLDFLSNGFKLRGTSGNINTSSNTYIYMAFAEEPLVGDNPATAR